MTHTSVSARLLRPGLLAGSLLPLVLSGPAAAQLKSYPQSTQAAEVAACMPSTQRKAVDLHRCVCTLDVIAAALTPAEYDALVSALGGKKLTTTTTTVALSTTTKLTTAQRTTATASLLKLRAALEKAKTECL